MSTNDFLRKLQRHTNFKKYSFVALLSFLLGSHSRGGVSTFAWLFFPMRLLQSYFPKGVGLDGGEVFHWVNFRYPVSKVNVQRGWPRLPTLCLSSSTRHFDPGDGRFDLFGRGLTFTITFTVRFRQLSFAKNCDMYVCLYRRGCFCFLRHQVGPDRNSWPFVGSVQLSKVEESEISTHGRELLEGPLPSLPSHSFP